MFQKRFRPKKFRKKGPLSTRQVLFITFFLFLATSMISFSFVNQTVEPIVMNIAKNEINRIATEAIYDAVEENMENINMNDFIVPHTNGTTTINPKTSITLRAKITKDIQKKLGFTQPNTFNASTNDKEQFKAVVYYIPLGVVTGNNLLANYGPKIPVKMASIGHVESDFTTKMTDSGINNVLLELIVHFKVNMQIVIPSFSEETLVQQDINVGGILIKGDVPSYYSNGTGTIAPAIMKPE